MILIFVVSLLMASVLFYVRICGFHKYIETSIDKARKSLEYERTRDRNIILDRIDDLSRKLENAKERLILEIKDIEKQRENNNKERSENTFERLKKAFSASSEQGDVD